MSTQFVIPRPGLLQERSASADSSLISAPFYSKVGLSWIELRPESQIEFWTRLNPYEWRDGVCDPPALLEFLARFGAGNAKLLIGQKLHAKVYLFDSNYALYGSSNLTFSGFCRNPELLALSIERPEIESLTRYLSGLRARLTELNIAQFRSIVEITGDVIEKSRGRVAAEVDDDLEAAISLVDQEVVGDSEIAVRASVPPQEEFERYLARQHDPISASLLVMARNTDGQNRTGHFKQSYYAVWRFLSASQTAMVTDLASLPLEDLRQVRPPLRDLLGFGVLQAWSAFLERNARFRDAERGISFSTLRTALPESLGGLRVDGGGGSGTLLRALPCVARFMRAMESR